MIKYFLALLFSSSLLFSATEVVNVINIDYYIGPCEAVTTDFAAAEASCLARYPDVTYQPLAASTALALDPDYNATSYLSAPSFELDTSYVVSSAWKNSYHNRIYVYMATNKAYNFYYVAPPENCVRTHPIWPPRAFILSQLTHQHLARLRIDYLASQESVMRG